MRRIGLAVLTASLILAPLAAEAQSSTKIPRIGFLSESRQPWDEAFREGLRELGYVEGRNIAIEQRYGGGNPERLPGLAADLLRLDVVLIVAGGARSIRAAKQATSP